MGLRFNGVFDGYKGIPREANLLIYASFFNWAAAGLLFITLQVFLVLEGLSFAMSGLIVGTFGITSALATWPFGILADRYGRKRFVIGGGVVSAIAITLFAIVGTNVSLLFGGAILSGFSEARFASSWTAMIADKATNAWRTRAFTLSFFVSTISSAAGGFSTIILGPFYSLLGISLVQGHRYLFAGVAGISLLGPAIVSRVSDSKPSGIGNPHLHFLPRKS